MKLTTKILALLFVAIVSVICVFSSMGIYFSDKNLSEESSRSHRMIYSLFMPTLTRYLWEFDLDGLHDGMRGMIESGYAKKINIYDADEKLIIGLSKDPKTNKMIELKDQKSQNEIGEEKRKKLLGSVDPEAEKMVYLIEEHMENDTSRMLGVMLHKKRGGERETPIGLILFEYRVESIIQILKDLSTVLFLVLTSFVLILVVAIGYLLRKILINPIIQLSLASIDISQGKYTKVGEKSSNDEMAELIKNFNAMAMRIEQNIHEQKEKQRLVNEQETARLVQTNLLPTPDLKKIEGFDLISHFEAAAECAGDWWGYYSLPDGRLLILLGDVTGHGTASAILTAVVKGFCDSIRTQHESLSAAELLEQLDTVVYNGCQGSRVMTMFAAVLDPVQKTIEFSNAAHNSPFLIQSHANSLSSQKLMVSGKPLGLNSSTEKRASNYLSKRLALNLGDLLFVFSDGLTEALNEAGEEFSERRLKKLLEAHSHRSVVEIKEEIIKNLRQFTGGQNRLDDVTFVICRYAAVHTHM